MKLSAPGLDNHTYIVLVTRGHQHDVECLVEVLDDPLAYIGMIGSRRYMETHPDPEKIIAGISLDNLGRVYYQDMETAMVGQYEGYAPIWLGRSMPGPALPPRHRSADSAPCTPGCRACRSSTASWTVPLDATPDPPR